VKRLSFVLLSLVVSPLLATEQQVLSKVYPIVKKYKSMEGPSGAQTIYLGDRHHPELLWLTSIRTQVVGQDGKTLKSPELMCHMNVDLDPAKHKSLFNLQRYPAARLITISQGMRVASGAFEARLPAGFGFPIASNEPLFVMTQVLNHNIEHPRNLKVRHRVTFEYVRNRDLQQRLIPLFNLAVSGMVQMGGGTQSVPAGDHTGTSCLIGARAPNSAGMSSDYVDPHGRKMTGHWVVPPGKQVNASDATWFMALPYDTKLHYAAVHLHPFAESLTLRDTTTGTDLFKAQTINPKNRVGLEHVDSFVNLAGVPMYKNHQYEMISVYDNPRSTNADSMASMFLGVADPEFIAPSSTDLLARSTALIDASAVVLRTTSGDVGAILMRNVVPETVMQFARLINVGAFRGARATVTESSITFTAAVTDDLRKFVSAHEAGGEHRPGAVSFCTTLAEISFVLVTKGEPRLDGRCTVFAQVGPGGDVLRAITERGSAQLLRAEILSAVEVIDLRLAPAKRASK
jgi:cyclophilin family peptidyl-prolyl cis-trans isomerase